MRSSSTRRGLPRGVAIGIVLLVASGTPQVAYGEDAPSAGVRPLTAVELHKLYRDRTWNWRNGAAHFFDDGRRFLAWVTGDDGESFGEGRFTLSDAGRMCLIGDWTDRDGTGSDTTCFLHRGDGETIYQKREGQGDWYVFRHDPVRPDDEVNKLVEGDDVSARVTGIRSALGR